MTVLDNLRACVEMNVPYDLPVFGLTQEFDARYTGHSLQQYLNNPDIIIATQIRVIERFGWDWSWLHLDGTLEFEPLGVGVQTGDNQMPVIADHLPFNGNTIRGLSVPNPRTKRMPLLLDTIRGMREARGDSTCITGRVMAPFSALTQLFGYPVTLNALAEHPRLIKSALAFTQEMAITWGLTQIKAGAHAIWLNDYSASTPFITLDDYKKWAFESCAEVVRVLQEAGALVFLYTGEMTPQGLGMVARTKPSVLGLGPVVDIVRVRSILPEIALMGNIDPMKLQMGSASQVAAETDRQVRVAMTGGMMLNSGARIPRDAKAPNLHTMVDTARKVWNLVHART